MPKKTFHQILRIFLITGTISLFSACGACFSQRPGRVRQAYMDSLPQAKRAALCLHYTKIKNTGNVILFFSPIVAGSGLGTLFPAVWAYDQGRKWVASQKLQGAILMGIGGIGIVTGIMMSVKGKRNMKIYCSRDNKFTFDLAPAPGLTGVSLTCRF